MSDIFPGTLKVILDPQRFAYETGVTLRGFSASFKPDGWQVIFRGTKRNGSFVYCLYVAVELEDALQGLYWSITGKGGQRYWYPDKYVK